MNPLDARRRMLGRNVYKKTVEGNPAIAQGSLARRYPGITMQGWTEQAQYEGNQLLDKIGIELSNVPQYIPVNVGDGDFTLSTDYVGTAGQQDIFFLAGNVESGAQSNTNGVKSGAPRTVTSVDGYVTVAIRKQNDDDLNPENYQIMLNSGSTALPYEPYTGGAPSPNPDYPQEITSAGKYDEGTGKWKYEVKLTGANLFNPDGEIVDGSPYDGIPLNNKGIVSNALYEKNPDVDVSNIYFGICSEELNSNGVIWALASGTIQSGGKIIFPMNNRYVCWYPGNDATLQKLLSRYDVMVNYGDGVYLPYQPYKEQTVTLTSDRPLTKWDRLEKRNGQWGWVYKSAEIVLDGSENYAIYDRGAPGYPSILFSHNMTGKKMGQNNLYCEQLKYSNNIFNEKNLEYCYMGYNANNGVYIGISTGENVTNVSEFKAWLSENPITFLYETDKETFAPLSEAEQEQMNELYTFRPTTVLSNDCDCNMILTYKTKKSLEVTD